MSSIVIIWDQISFVVYSIIQIAFQFQLYASFKSRFKYIRNIL